MTLIIFSTPTAKLRNQQPQLAVTLHLIGCNIALKTNINLANLTPTLNSFISAIKDTLKHLKTPTPLWQPKKNAPQHLFNKLPSMQIETHGRHALDHPHAAHVQANHFHGHHSPRVGEDSTSSLEACLQQTEKDQPR